jgi:GNAT superfamily N-acetyltransferase
VSGPAITCLSPGAFAAATDDLGSLLADVVNAGASVGFLRPLAPRDAAAWWRSIADDVRAGHVIVLVARIDGRLAGTAQLRPARIPNQTHRADVAKVLVHPEMRRRGIGNGLMSAVEREARQRSRTLLVLDSETGSAGDGFYTALGWTRVGEIPGYAADTDGTLRSTTIFYKELR